MGWSTCWREPDSWVPARDRVANGNTGILAALIGFIVPLTQSPHRLSAGLSF